MPLVRLLRSAAFARAVLLYLAALSGAAAWLPWVRGVDGSPAPAWATRLAFDHPFSSPWFLAGVAALFASTLACTWGKRARTLALWRGEFPPAALRLAGGGGRDPGAFLHERGFRGEGRLLFRYRPALWGGWLLHVGLLLLIAGVAVQQAFHDEANFELVPGEQTRLSDPGAAFQRSRGPFAPSAPPDVVVELLDFDPFRHQAGYAPDRVSVLSLRRSGWPARRAELDRAAGVHLGAIAIHQAIPTGLAATVEAPDGRRLALHLATLDARSAAATAPAGATPARLVATTERGIEDPLGTGRIDARLEAGGASLPVAVGGLFSFGGTPLRLVGWTRWAGFTYSRAPGMSGVLAGFLLVLAGALLLAFPAGLARLPGPGENGALVWLPRGGEALSLEWERLSRDP